MSIWTKYRRINDAEMRPIVRGEDLKGVSVSDADNLTRYEDPALFDRGFVARNSQNHADQWYVARAYFEANFEPIGE